MSKSNLVIIDNSIQDYSAIIDALQTDTKYILLDGLTDTYDTLKTKISDLAISAFSSIGIIQHNMGGGTYSLFRNADDDAATKSTLANVIESDPNLDSWTDYQNFITYFKDEYSMENFDLMACALYSDANWKYVIDTLETRTGVNIRASKDDTGSAQLGGNWFLETDSINLKDVYFTDAIDEFRGMLATGPHTVVIGTDNTIYATGNNGYGQLGNGTTTDRNTPTAMTTTNWLGKTPKSISCGVYYTVVLMTDGTIYATGENGFGQLGDGTTTNRSTLTAMTTTNWSGKTPKSISCGGHHTVVLMTDGTIYGTGYNFAGQLGDGTNNSRNTLTAMTILSGKTPKSISCGTYHTVVLMTDGSIYATGYNHHGQVGDGTTTNRSTLTAMTTTNWSGKTPKSISCGGYHTVVLMTDGTIYTTGYNDYGQLGDGSSVTRYTLTVMTTTNWYSKTPKSIFCGEYHTVVLMTDGIIYATGYNPYGQLGDGTSATRYTLTAMTILSGKTPKSISCGGYHTVVLMTDGSIYATGYNGSGQLGDGTTTNRSTLTAISGSYRQLADTESIVSSSPSVAGLYAFEGHTFTNASATGRTGPTLSAVRSSYSTMSWATDTTNNYVNMTSDNGIQLWKVPATGQYVISCAGASGGNANTYTGGLGRRVTGLFTLVKGEILKILVGQSGSTVTNAYSPGGGNYDLNRAGTGGGGTFVTLSDNSILLIGGGGGGARDNSYGYGTASSGLDAPQSTSGNGYSGGGTNGGGGGGSYWGGGGGYSGDGAGELKGAAFLNNGLGGISVPDGRPGGGFGGGGGGYNDSAGRPGGGGGYSGGASTEYHVGNAGGGGSFLGIVKNATSTIYGELNTGHGFVTIIPNFTITGPFVEGLYPFAGHTFTTAGTTGRSGPTITAVRSAYSNESWAQDTTNNYLNMSTQGIQEWKVPATGSYTIRAAGAGSGYTINGMNQFQKGMDATITTTLTKGEIIKILVGQMSTPGSSNGRGGGGGSFIVRGTQTPIIVAGGGGGRGNNMSDISSNATTSISGQTGSGSGTTGNNAGGAGGDANGSEGITTAHGGGGGGLIGNGTNIMAGLSFINGGSGGNNIPDGNNAGSNGGFGGGGGNYSGIAGGGGGGYSGGGGGGHLDGWSSGGGGGSYSITGSFASAIANNNSNGFVTIIPNFTITGPAVVGSYLFEGHIFTNAGTTGRTGPTLSAVRSAYSSASWAQDTTNNYLNMTNNSGIQLWKVPATGSYTIKAAGAMGGGNVGAGLGACIEGSFNLTSGNVIRILVGQMGGQETYEVASGQYSGGGGGGTFVVLENGFAALVIAGGGGGRSQVYAHNASNNETDTFTGTAGNAGSNSEAYGGAGYIQNSSSYIPHTTGDIAYSYVNGGVGGLGSPDGGQGYGGFGGGGGEGYADGGGGGGYSGGNAGAQSASAGGGGSFFNTTIGSLRTNYTGSSGHGYVTITPNFIITMPSPTITWANISKPITDSAFGLIGSLAPTTNSAVSYGSTWNKLGADIDGEAIGDKSGSCVSMSADGTVVAIGAPFNAGANGRESGQVRVYAWNGSAWAQRGADIDGDSGLSSLPMVVTASGTSGSRNWYNISISSTGQYQTAVVNSGNIYTSLDYGVNWTERAIVKNWYNISISSTGQYQTAVVNSGNIYTSSNYGVNWMERDATRLWSNVSLSSTGQYQTAVVTNGNIYTSSNYGVNWSSTGSSQTWYGVSISSNGQYQTAVGWSTGIHVSSNYGVTWTEISNTQSAGGSMWLCVSLSSTGQYQSAGSNSGVIYISSDYGVTWTYKASATDSCRCISVSSTGQYQTAVSFIGYIFSSSDHGVSWTTRDISRRWAECQISLSASGQYQTISSSTNGLGLIYFSRNYGVTWSEYASYEITEGDQFATSVSLSASGNSVAVGAPYFDSSSMINRGQVRVYDWSGSAWSARGSNIMIGEATNDYSGMSVSMSANGNVVAIGAPFNDGANGTNSGQVRVYSWSGSAWAQRGADIDGKYGLTATNRVVTASGTFTETQIKSVSMSSSGQYQTAVGWQRLIRVSSDFGVNWVQKGNGILYTGVSVSSTGQYQTATVSNEQFNDGKIMISSDFGMNWISKAGNLNWYGVSISSSGQYQTSVVHNGQIWISSDFGNTWAAKDSNRTWNGISISSSGQYQSATVYGGQIWISSDFGMNWIAKASSLEWNSVSVSSSGQYQSATVYGGKIWISSDFGMNWEQKASSLNWGRVTISSSGQYQTAVVLSGQIWISLDFGMNWASKASSANWSNCYVSSSGQYQIAYENNQYNMYFSRDYGNTWSTTASYEITEGDQFGTSVSLSADGSTLAVGAPLSDNGNVIDCGHVRVYNWNGSAWVQRGSDIDGEATNDKSGTSVSMSADGTVVAIGAPNNNGGNGIDSGSVRVYNWNGSAWNKRGADIDGEAGVLTPMKVVTATGTSGTTNWRGVSISSTGQYQTAVVSGGQIYTSSDYGINWTPRYSTSNWFSVSLSSTGQYQTSVFQGQIHTSSDYGINWTPRYSITNLFSASVSSTGQYQTAVADGGQIHTSSNYGINWTPRYSSLSWWSVSVSSNGQYQTAVVNGGQIHTSSDFGINWTPRYSSLNWRTVSVSSTGQYQTAVVNGGQIHTSSDFGINWTPRYSSLSWFSVYLSSTGQYQTAVVNGGQIHTSSNFGIDWTTRYSSYNNSNWLSVSVSSTGQYQTALVDGGVIHFSRDYGFTWSNYASYEVVTGGDQSGVSVSLSSNGTSVAIGAPHNDGVSGADVGHVRVYDWDGSSYWVKRAVDIDGEANNDLSGRSVSLSSDGTVVAIGAPMNTGANGIGSGSVRVYKSDSFGNFSYTSSNTAVAEVYGSIVVMKSSGSTTLTATQSASPSYTSGTATATLTVDIPSLYTFTGHTFTNAGTTGRTGPTLSAVRTAYSGVSWAQDTTNNYLNMTTQGIQLWTVPQTGSYTFRAIGAGSEFANSNGGQGVDITTTTTLTKGDVIKILVGQKGGGGGATYVVKHDGTPIIVAGGGGAAYNSTTFINTIHLSNATTNNAGNNSFFYE